MQLLLLTFLSSALLLPAAAEHKYHLVTSPESPVVEIGINFTATCVITDTAVITADDLYWNLSKTTVPKEQYTKIDSSTLNVTIFVTGEKPEWLFCLSKKVSPYVVFNEGKFRHGIMLRKGYLPGKPENLSCIAVQEGQNISPNLSCEWDPVGRQTPDVPTEYTLTVNVLVKTFTVTTRKNSAKVNMDLFPFHMTLEIWVTAHNQLGQIESEHLKEDAGWFVKTNPPSDVKVISEKTFTTSLLINWTHTITAAYMSLTYEIRFCPSGSQNWTNIPRGDTAQDIQSFRLQNLRPDTLYVTQVRCKNARKDHGYWSDWSVNATKRTPEDRPTSKPDLWIVITEGDGTNVRQVQIICKDPVFANGKLLSYNIKVQEQKVKNGSSEWESIPVNRSEAGSSSGQWELLKKIDLADKISVKVQVTASNSMGTSPEAFLGIPEKEFPPVQELKVGPRGGQLWVEWRSPVSSGRNVSGYVVEWVDGSLINWQRESRSTRRTAIKGKLEKFVCYNVSVYPLYSGWIGKPTSLQAFLEEGVPSGVPSVRVNSPVGCDKAELVWDPIPQHRQRGFITIYTIFYTNGTKVNAINVPGNTTSYTLKSLSRDTKYDVWLSASTISGSANGSNHSFTTARYAPGEIEGIVVAVSLGVLFFFLLIMLTCIYKKDVIKENFWPRIPNPGESTIGNWSPDYPLKAETPKENCLSGISVLDVDVCDGKCVFEEDKASLPLKKDKYLSEEHSSGIGGSSCMSSPRQSVSDSDEGGDMADTTASTVQYSSVVANGYKGQTPSSQPQQAIFSRSESTQPLLDSEENPDMLVQEGSRQCQRFPRQPCFTLNTQNAESANVADFNQLEMEQQEVLETLDFCPLEEDSEQTTPTDSQSADWLPTAPVSSYMPQLGGYRPQ